MWFLLASSEKLRVTKTQNRVYSFLYFTWAFSLDLKKVIDGCDEATQKSHTIVLYKCFIIVFRFRHSWVLCCSNAVAFFLITFHTHFILSRKNIGVMAAEWFTSILKSPHPLSSGKFFCHFVKFIGVHFFLGKKVYLNYWSAFWTLWYLKTWMHDNIIYSWLKMIWEKHCASRLEPCESSSFIRFF